MLGKVAAAGYTVIEALGGAGGQGKRCTVTESKRKGLKDGIDRI